MSSKSTIDLFEWAADPQYQRDPTGEVVILSNEVFDKLIYPGVDYFDTEWETQCAQFKLWMEANPDVYYYGRPRERFFVRQAIEEAKAAGKKFLLLEDLS